LGITVTTPSIIMISSKFAGPLKFFRKAYEQKMQSKGGWNWEDFQKAMMQPDGSPIALDEIGMYHTSLDTRTMPPNGQTNDQQMMDAVPPSIREVENQKIAFTVRNPAGRLTDCSLKWAKASGLHQRVAKELIGVEITPDQWEKTTGDVQKNPALVYQARTELKRRNDHLLAIEMKH
jgi:hypothetical protein